MKLIKIVMLILPLLLFAKEATVKQLFSVQTIKVKKISSSHSQKNYGYIKADDSRVYDVTSRFGGYVVKLYANKIYKYVNKGEALVTLYSPEVYKAKEDYLNSYNYTKGRKNRGMLRSSKLKLELLGVSQKEIKAVLASKKVSKNTTIYAPQSGYIFEKNLNDGSAFNAKMKLFKIVNLDEVWVETKIFDKDVLWLKKATSFLVSVKSTSNKYTTNTRLLYPNLDPKEATLTLRLRLKNKNNELLPGMYANIISKDTEKEYLTLPRSAVIRKNRKFYVFVVSEFEGEYEPLEVSVEVLNNTTYIITNTLNAGDKVVNNALFMMDSDAQINGLY
ncbi:MAG: efflux RND transporter periplasmic adaptor subunit [Sulfurimonas sp.]